MRIATITNWAYSATVCLTIASGVVMLMASSADNTERQVVEQRYQFDQLTEEVENRCLVAVRSGTRICYCKRPGSA